MEELKLYLIKNFILICLSIVLVVNSLLRYKQHQRISICVLGITAIAVYLSIGNAILSHVKGIGDINAVMVLSYFGYVLRPICVLLLILMAGKKIKKKYRIFSVLPLIVNAIVFIFAFIPATKAAVFFYEFNDAGYVAFHGGPLRFSSHIISAIYLALLMVISIKDLKGKHFSHGISILFCSLFVVGSVVIESFFNDDGTIDYLLNNTIVAGTVVYYLFLYTEKSQIDVLTGLFNRATYYQDIAKMGKSITAIVQFDMNGLKYLNDTYGHDEGDKALRKIGNIIFNHATRKMYVYRLGGDEFTMIATNTEEDVVRDVIGKIKEDLANTEYHCSIGYSCQYGRNIDVEELSKEAESMMYKDKAEFYKTAKFERRKADKFE